MQIGPARIKRQPQGVSGRTRIIGSQNAKKYSAWSPLRHRSHQGFLVGRSPARPLDRGSLADACSFGLCSTERVVT
jgi:hypothetical protein